MEPRLDTPRPRRRGAGPAAEGTSACGVVTVIRRRHGTR